MYPSEAAELLRKFNAYRRGEAPYPDVSTLVIGEAIDLAIKFLNAAEPSDVRRFRFGSVTYEVFPFEGKYKVVKNNWLVAYTEDSFIYDYCDTESFIALKHNKDYREKHYKAKHMAVALFKKQKKG